jgi:hypothetical protein
MAARRSDLLIRLLATWLLGGTVLSVVLGLAVGIPVGLIIALGYAAGLSRTEALRHRRTREFAQRALPYPPR